MENKNFNSRRDFLKKVCPTVAFAFFGLSFLESCSTDDDSNESNDDDNNDSNDNNDNNDNNNQLGYTSSGNIFTIDLNNSNFSNLFQSNS